MCLFEMSAALCTGIRAVQALLIEDPTLTPKRGILYLLLEQGMAFDPLPHSTFTMDMLT
jgi:hypothetical protein